MKPRKLLSTLMMIGVVVAISALTTSAIAQQTLPQDGEDGGPQAEQTNELGMMLEMLYPERTWTTLCFQIPLEPEQFQQLGQLYAQVLQQRNTAAHEAIEIRDLEAYQKAGAEARATLEKALPTVLSDEQCQQLDTIVGGAFGTVDREAEPEDE